MSEPRDTSHLHLLTLEELASFVGRHPVQLRKYYAAGMLPEPKYRIQHARKTTRRFTLQEAERIRKDFQDAKWGTFAKRRRNAAKV
jgi:hypothetical protein